MTVAPVITPADAEAAADLLATARAEGRCVLPRGRGTRVARHSPESAPDLWLSSSQWRTIHALSPDDQTCEVDAGLAPSVLEAALAPHGLELAVNAPGPAAGTLGGLFLAPDLSLLQAAWGPPRDQVLGARWLLADGSVVNTGARVVKSVAGYDVTRLFLGSRGRLACCLRLILRLRPRPRAARWFRIDPAQLCRWLAADPPARIPARRLFSTRHADGLRVCAELDGTLPPPDCGATPLDPQEAAAELAACLERFGALPRRVQLGRGELLALLADAQPACADLLAGTVGFATDADLAAVPASCEHAVPRRGASDWLPALQRACAPGAPAFGERRTPA